VCTRTYTYNIKIYVSEAESVSDNRRVALRCHIRRTIVDMIINILLLQTPALLPSQEGLNSLKLFNKY
jgi:hypothetical protein